MSPPLDIVGMEPSLPIPGRRQWRTCLPLHGGNGCRMGEMRCWSPVKDHDSESPIIHPSRVIKWLPWLRPQLSMAAYVQNVWSFPGFLPQANTKSLHQTLMEVAKVGDVRARSVRVWVCHFWESSERKILCLLFWCSVACEIETWEMPCSQLAVVW